MSDPGQGRKFKITDLILIVLLVGLIYVIYTILGGDISTFTNITRGGASPVEQITEGLRSLGDGISKSFSSILR